MTMIVMLVTLTGSYGFPGGAPVIEGFRTMNACERAIPIVKEFYVAVDKVRCISLPVQ